MRGLGLFFIFLFAAVFCASAENRLTSSEQDRSQLATQQNMFAPGTNPLEDSWSAYKKKLYRLDIDLGLDISWLVQRASPDGRQTALQAVYYPYVTWRLFEQRAWGSGELNANYTLAHYWGAPSTRLQRRTGAAVTLNNYEDNQKNVGELSYTHTLPGTWDFLSATVGQYAIDNFDGSEYVDNQQRALVHNALSQNASAAYPDSSFGAYVQAQTAQVTAVAGYQDATNITGAQVRWQDAFSGQYTTFGMFMWTPQFALGNGQYGLLYYHRPAVEKQPGQANGWSFSAQQNVGNCWALFARVNGSNGGVTAVKNSYVFGGAWKDPLVRNPQDVVLVGVAYNRLSRRGLDEPMFMRRAETVVEAQWVWGLGKLVTFTPDIQFIPRGGLSERHRSIWVSGLRVTLML